MWVQFLAPRSGLKILSCCEQKQVADVALIPPPLWLWGRPGAAAPMRRLAWELPHAAGVALKSKKERFPLNRCVCEWCARSKENSAQPGAYRLYPFDARDEEYSVDHRGLILSKA